MAGCAVRLNVSISVFKIEAMKHRRFIASPDSSKHSNYESLKNEFYLNLQILNFKTRLLDVLMVTRAVDTRFGRFSDMETFLGGRHGVALYRGESGDRSIVTIFEKQSPTPGEHHFLAQRCLVRNWCPTA